MVELMSLKEIGELRKIKGEREREIENGKTQYFGFLGLF